MTTQSNTCGNCIYGFNQEKYTSGFCNNPDSHMLGNYMAIGETCTKHTPGIHDDTPFFTPNSNPLPNEIDYDRES